MCECREGLVSILVTFLGQRVLCGAMFLVVSAVCRARACFCVCGGLGGGGGGPARAHSACVFRVESVGRARAKYRVQSSMLTIVCVL